MKETLYTTFQILGSLAVFIYGMKLMSDGLQKAAGSKIREVLRSITKNRYRGLLTGLVTTALIQSSSATTVMTVSLVNAGLLKLSQSAGVMIGANIGTTSTSWLVTQLGFRFNLYTLCLPMFAIGVPLILRRRGKSKFWGEFLIGFAILFMGLNYLKISIPDIDTNSYIVQWIRENAGSGIAFRILFILIGAVLTILIQSSSAAIVLTITMCLKGWIPFELGACLVLGENIGTTVTAEFASLVGNVYARRSARIHTLFNFFGVSGMVLLLPWFLDLIAWFVRDVLHLADPSVNPSSSDYGLSIFHTVFNVLNAIVMLPLIGFLIKMARLTVKNLDRDDETKKLRFFRSGSRTPELAILELRKGISKYIDIVHRMHMFSGELINNYDTKEQSDLIARIRKYEVITDNLEREITEYITSISEEELSLSTSVMLRSMLNMCGELERMGDTYYKVSEDVDYKRSNKIWINQTQRTNLNELISLIDRVYKRILKDEDASHEKESQARDLLESAKRYAIHIKNPVVMQTPQDVTLDGEEVNLRGSIIYDNLHYQFSKIIENLDHMLNYSKGSIL